MHRISPDKFNRLMARLVKATPPCLSNTDDWGPGAATLEELSAELDAGAPNHFPEPSGERETIEASKSGGDTEWAGNQLGTRGSG